MDENVTNNMSGDVDWYEVTRQTWFVEDLVLSTKTTPHFIQHINYHLITL